MQQKPEFLEYRAERSIRSKSRWWLAGALGAVSIMIYGLRALATMPYRPPYDMSTFLGGPELALVQFLILLLFTVWCCLLVALIVSVWPKRRIR